MKKIKKIAFPIAFDEEKKYTYLTTSKKILVLDESLKILQEKKFLEDMNYGILVCNNKVLVCASPDGKIASYDLLNQKIISQPKNIIKYGSEHELFYNKEKGLIFRIGLGENKLRMLYSYKINEKGITTIDNEICLEKEYTENVIVNYEIFGIKDEELYLIETTADKKGKNCSVAFIHYDINTKGKKYTWKKKTTYTGYGKYDDNNIIDYFGFTKINVFNEEIKEISLGGTKFDRLYSQDKKHMAIWDNKEKKMFIKEIETQKILKAINFEFFFIMCEKGNHVFILSDGLYIYTKEEFYSI